MIFPFGRTVAKGRLRHFYIADPPMSGERASYNICGPGFAGAPML